MDMNRLTQKSQEALARRADQWPLRFGHTEVDGEHLLLALLDQPDGLVPRLLEQAGADVDGAARRPGSANWTAARGHAGRARRRARSTSPSGCPACWMPPSGRPTRLKDEYVSVEHLSSR